MEKFEEGDFIRLKNMDKYQVGRFLNMDVNIFEITSIKDESVEVKQVIGKIPVSEIEPIPINGKDDLQIYYDPIIMASIIGPYDPVPVHKKDYSYYYESFKRNFYEDKDFQELIKEKGLRYVHEVQHFLFDQFQDDGLKIHAI
ncbi:MAG: hypothetical protein AAGU19_01280 [Prolixibacteraceae bacterium]